MSTEAIIFDCDGVLIDSEIVMCRLVSEELTRVGYPLDVTEVIRRFAGRPEPEMIADIEQDWGRPVPPEYFARIKPRTIQAYGSELRAIPHVKDVVHSIRIPTCVASSSAPQKLKLGLDLVGLYETFAPNIVSASFVARGKPAPDVFIYAAGWLRAVTTACIIVEDSLPGVRAARAAGIRVFGFAGGSHCGSGHEEALVAAGAETTFTDFRDLKRLLPEAF